MNEAVIINRHNYEEVFLMYVDNELTPAQRADVEAFVQQNEDLADELNMLLQVTLMPEAAIQYDNKEGLYKREQGINLANCEEYFLLDVDNELNGEEKAEVEKFVLQHPQMQEGFTLLHQTKLEPETISFENKASLYRKEERRVVPIRWMRMAVAAAVIGIVGVLYLTIPGKDVSNATNTVATQPKTTTQPNTVPVPATKDKVDEQVAVTTDTKAAVSTTVSQVLPKPNVVANKKALIKNLSNEAVVTSKPAPKPALQTNDLPERMSSNDIAINKLPDNHDKDNLAPVINNRNSNSNIITEKNTTSLAAARLKEDENEVMKQAVYREVDNNNEEEENTFLIGSARINKNKLKGLFKKASGLFNKKGDKNEHQRSIQIAGFEIKS